MLFSDIKQINHTQASYYCLTMKNGEKHHAILQSGKITGLDSFCFCIELSPHYIYLPYQS